MLKDNQFLHIKLEPHFLALWLVQYETYSGRLCRTKAVSYAIPVHHILTTSNTKTMARNLSNTVEYLQDMIERLEKV